MRSLIDASLTPFCSWSWSFSPSETASTVSSSASSVLASLGIGGYLAGAKHAPAGTKRISNLLRSPRWRHELSRFLLSRADERLQELEAQEEVALVLWDDSELEKPESEKLEGLGIVCSGKAKRLKKYRKGCYNPPGKTVIVPGIHWSGCVLTGMQGVASLVMMRWWTNRGKCASRMRNQHRAMLRILQRGLGAAGHPCV